MRFACRRCANGAKIFPCWRSTSCSTFLPRWAGTSAASPRPRLKLLIAYDWPGNVRELENVIERAIVTCRNGMLDEQDFSWLQRQPGQPQSWEVPDVSLGELERRAIVAALERKHGNVKEASTAWESTARHSTTNSSVTRSCTDRRVSLSRSLALENGVSEKARRHRRSNSSRGAAVCVSPGRTVLGTRKVKVTSPGGTAPVFVKAPERYRQAQYPNLLSGTASINPGISIPPSAKAGASVGRAELQLQTLQFPRHPTMHLRSSQKMAQGRRIARIEPRHESSETSPPSARRRRPPCLRCGART